MNEYIITIPDWMPTPLNKLLSAHWAKRSKMKNADYKVIDHYVRLARIPIKSVKKRVQITLCYPKGERMLDPDACLKSLLDGLVKAYALWNDSPKFCEIMPVESVRGEKKSTTIRITEIV
jgi:Holliday junction resolvase RusA-like endonuclease